MSVYVGVLEYKYLGNMLMSHMVADTIDELNEMADKIGVKRKWLQKSNNGISHYDICKSNKIKAIKNGAIEISDTEIIRMFATKSPEEILDDQRDQPSIL